MDSIKKKLEKLANETAEAEARIAHFEEIKAQNEAEAEKFEEQLRTIQKRCKPWRVCLMFVLKTCLIKLCS